MRAWRDILIAVTFMAIPLDLAAACSVADSYRVPTTLELVHRSDAIVTARVGDASIVDRDGYQASMLALTPEILISGQELPGQLQLEAQHSEVRWRATASNPEELAEANPDAFVGACNRDVFDRGMLLLLFLEQSENGELRIIDMPFARTLEDVTDENALWVRAVRYYAGIAQLGQRERRAAMVAERERLQATGDRRDAILARDIGRQLSNRRTINRD